MLEGSCRLHPPTVPHPSRSVIQKENAKKILDLISNIIHLLTGEVAIRCEDVSIYFSMEEWEYLKGNKTLYREVIKENPRQIHPLGFENIDEKRIKSGLEANLLRKSEPEKTLPSSVSHKDVHDSNMEISSINPQLPTNCESNGINMEQVSLEGDRTIKPLTINIQENEASVLTTDSTKNNSLSANYISNGIKEEGECSDCTINPLTEQITLLVYCTLL
ncbi:hypothetical protein GDO86_018974 [Hymenochirus boettgeri]|nr:hypothetical protein GDO86_018974 [Hymenochirus boettgeri]